MEVFIAENDELLRPLLLQYAMFYKNLSVKDVTQI
jgi:hypothetical protein